MYVNVQYKGSDKKSALCHLNIDVSDKQYFICKYVVLFQIIYFSICILFPGSRLDNIVIGGYRQLTRNVDQSKQIIITPWGQECHFDEIGKLLNMDFLKHKFEFAEKMKTLDLSVQEEAVMRAIVITSTGKLGKYVCPKCGGKQL